MTKDTPQIVGNRYAQTITNEIRLLNKTTANHLTDLNFGFRFHNLASPCEMLIQYWGEKLSDYSFLMQSIYTIGAMARSIDNWFLTHAGQEVFASDLNDIRREITTLNDFAQKLVPILFF